VKLIYCITRSDTLGGAHIHVRDLASWMRRNGHEVTVIVGGEGPYCDVLAAQSVPYIASKHLCRPISLFSDILAVAELRRIFRSLHPDLISLHSAKAGLVGRFAAIGLKIPVLFTAHGWAFTEGVSPGRARLFRMLERLAAPLAARIITVSDYDRSLALCAGIAPPERVQTILNAMPDVTARAEPGHNFGAVRLTMVARLDDPKDHRALLAALSSIRDKEWLLDLVGDGPFEPQLRAMVQTSGLEGRVRFLGLRTDVDQILSESHIFVLTSNWEGLPRSILEAMRAGLPVVASSVGGVPEIVTEDETGYLIARGDVATLSERLAYLIDSPEERARLGRNARMRFEERYRFERMAIETLVVYQAVLG
jgi:glycosyltransferase involved in cell wall biosynthesis